MSIEHKVGDLVWYPDFGLGMIYCIKNEETYPYFIIWSNRDETKMCFSEIEVVNLKNYLINEQRPE